ncbi:MAG: autotransporter-associated beta strand repeat-containing protein [Akkermansiaceae bacterium]|nr:autotransporter-associated beta strand repeat-containing protein [Akkermansiaceae bacterium]
MKPKFRTSRLLAGASLSFTMAALLTQSALADYLWNNGGGDSLYSNPANWTGTNTDNNLIENGDTVVVNTVISWNPNDLLLGVTGGSLTNPTSGTLNITSGSLSANYWTKVGDWAGNATLNITGSGSYTSGALNGNGNILVGLYGSTGVLNVNTTGSLTASGIYVAPNNVTDGGNLPTSGGTFNLDAGTVNVSGDVQIGSDFFGQGTVAAGDFNMTGGEMNVGNLFEVGHLGLAVTSGTSSATISGGTLNIENDLKLGFAGNTGTAAEMTITGAGTEVNVASGTTRWVILGQYDPIDVTMTISNGATLNLDAGTDIRFGIDGNSGTRLLDIDNATVNSLVGGTAIVMHQGSAGVSTTNITGGSLVQVDEISGSAADTLNLDDATLECTADNANFINVVGGAVNVGSGGLTIDTDFWNVTVKNTLLEAPTTGGDLNVIGEGKVTLAAGANITGTTTVAAFTKLGGTGTLAGPLVIEDDAELHFVNNLSTGLLTVPSLTLGTGNTMTFEVGGGNADQVAVTGTYNAPTGLVTVEVEPVGSISVGTRTLISGAAGIDVNDFDLVSSAPIGYDWELQVSGNDLQLVISSLSPAAAFWKGGVDAYWSSADSGGNFNWAQDDSGAASTVTGPGISTDVTFSADGSSNEATLLGDYFEINSLTYDASAGNVTISEDGGEDLSINYGITNNSSNEQVINVPLFLTFDQSIAGAADITLNSTVDAGAGLTKTGAGTLAVNGDMSVTNALQVNGGILDAAAGVSASSVAIAAGSTTATMNVPTGATVDVSGVTAVGAGGDVADTQSGTLNITGGIWNNENDVTVGGYGAAGASGVVNVSAGTLNVGTSTLRWLKVGDWNTAADAQLNVTGTGVVNFQGGSNIQFRGASGAHVVNVDGGTIDGAFDVSAADYYMWMGIGTVNVKNSGQITDWGRIDLGTGTLNVETNGSIEALGGVDAWEGVVNVNTGGVLETAWLASGTGTAATGVVNVDNGTIRATGDNATFFNFWNNAAGITIGAGGATIDTNGFAIGYSPTGNNPITGTGNLTKTGLGTLSLANAVHTYTGDTIVSAGTLAVDGSSLPDTGTLTIGATALVDVTGTEVVAGIDLGSGVITTPGTFGPVGSGAGTESALITGTGLIQVGAAAGGFDDWIAGFGLDPADQDPTDDPDNDGVSNIVEYVLGRDPSVGEGAASTGVKNGANFELSFERSDLSLTSADVTILIEYGNDLAGWTEVEVPAASGTVGGVVFTITDGDPTDSIVASIPTSSATEFFARVKVVK